MAYSIRRSVNTVLYEDLSIWSYDPFEIIRTAPFWASYGKDGKSPRKMLSLEQMEDEHIEAILKTQHQICGTDIEQFFLQEVEYRKKIGFKEDLNQSLPQINPFKKQNKV